MNKAAERLYNGLIKENPTFVLMLGMCPTLAVTTSAVNGIRHGTYPQLVILALSNVMISALQESDSGRRPDAGLYRDRGLLRDDRTVSSSGVCAGPLRVSGHLYSADRCKLYHSGQSRGLRFQKSGDALLL